MNDAMRLIYFDPEEPRRDAPFLDEQHLSIFSWPEARLRGRRLSDAFAKIDDHACLGAFDSAEMPPESLGVAAAGWAWDRVRRTPVKRVIFVDSQDVIIGFASGGWSPSGRSPCVARGAEGRRRLERFRESYGSRAHSWLRFSTTTAAPPASWHPSAPTEARIGTPPVEVDLATLGAIIDTGRVLSGGWTSNGQHPSAGAPGVAGAVFRNMVGQ